MHKLKSVKKIRRKTFTGILYKRIAQSRAEDKCDTMSWIYAHICIHTCVCACTHTCVRVYVCMYIYICIYAHAQVCVCAHTHTHTHLHTHTHTYTHIYMWQDELDSAWVSNFKC